MTTLKVPDLPQIIEILEITDIKFAHEVREDETAVYPCDVKWQPIPTPTATPRLIPFENIATVGMIKIVSILKSAIKPGIYQRSDNGVYSIS
ncbi:MAG: hypothetical protein ABIO57_03535 [Candidatus Paceibacterota bacterium]